MKALSGSPQLGGAASNRQSPRPVGRWLTGAALGLLTLAAARPASACGGFFCSATNPVNQAAERIVFAKNADKTVTAVIEIQYQGPSTNFSWLLPISTVPKGDQIAVASNAAFQRLQQATNPQYNLTIRVEGTCDEEPFRPVPTLAVGGTSASGNFAEGGPGGVTVEASGIVGSFEWTVISLDKSLTDPAGAAVTWLGKNGYDVPASAPGLLGPYLADGMNLLALRLKKGADTGSIRPIVLTYAADKPMIPIKLTSVAANENMGVMTWLLGDARAVPQNYYALELNEARINWFNAGSNYNDVVTAAADDGGGQGFVTEMAGPSSALKSLIWTDREEQAWQRIQQYGPLKQLDAYADSLSNFSGLDGFSDVAQAHVTFAAGVSADQVKQCPGCYSAIAVDAGFVPALEANVVEPMRVVQKLVDAHPQMTRLYTTMSASEMTVDPLFGFNPDLEPVSNVHTAERVIECARGYYQSTAPWRIELPHGGVVRGGPAELGTWPAAFASQPPNRLVMRQGDSGAGKVLEDNSAKIAASISDYSAGLPRPTPNPGMSGNPGTSNPGSSEPGTNMLSSSGGGCNLSGERSSAWLWGALLGLGFLIERRRR